MTGVPASLISVTLAPALYLLRELHGALGLVALVVGDEARAQDVQALEQQACASGVLAGDEVGLAECLPCALAQVLQIADWRWADGEPAGHQPLPPSSSSIAIVAAPTMPASGPELRGRDRGLVHRRKRPCRQLRARGSQEKVPGRDHAAADDDHVGVEDVREARESHAQASAHRLEHPGRNRIALERSLGHLLAVELDARGQCRPSAESGALSAAARPSRAIAVPDAITSTHPWLGQFPWQGGPSASITTWPSSAPAPADPGRARRRSPAPHRSRCRS
jgi:hypothetical protein